MRGNLTIHFSSLVADTISVHGLEFAVRYYFARLPKFEARFFVQQAFLSLQPN